MTQAAGYRKHKCPVRDCVELVSYRKFACPQHWAVLPSELKSDIYAGYTVGPLSDQHLDAMSAAKRWYNEHLGAPRA